MGKYFGTDGFRGEAGIDLTADHAYKVGRFLGWYYNMLRERNGNNEPARIVIGKDTRRSSYMFEYSLVAGLTASGADAYLLHVTTTPSVAYIARVDDFDCGIMISASHNPYYDNGIKLIDCYGEKMPEETLLLVEDYIDGKLHVFDKDWPELPFAHREHIGCTVDYVAGRNRYMGYLISLGIYSFKGVKVGLDCANGASWNLHMVYSDQIVTDHCVIKSDGVWNGDGWDPDSSTNCTIFACEFCTGDDAVAIKSGKNPEGNIIDRPTKHIRVFDCHSGFGHGICIGSEMSGGVEDVKIWDCDMAVSTSGLEIKVTKKRGGYVRNVEVRDCTLSHVMVHSVGYNDDGIGAPVPPVLEDFRYNRVTLLGRYIDHDHVWHTCPAIELKGFDVPGYEVKNICFKDVVLEDNGGPEQNIRMQYCRNVSFENITVRSGVQPE